MQTSIIKPGDLILIDGPATKGSDGLAQGTQRYHAQVIDNNGRLTVRRLSGGKSFIVRSRLVIGHWRASAATRRGT